MKERDKEKDKKEMGQPKPNEEWPKKKKSRSGGCIIHKYEI